MIPFLLIDLAGLICGLLLFWRRRVLPRDVQPVQDVRVSVIIPARNEAVNLPILLASLARQSRLPDEVIVVDDDSADGTGEIAKGMGVQPVSLKSKPDGWLGKSWACQQGAEQATGDLLLFLDADVELGEMAIDRMLSAWSARPGVVSVQPWHRVRRPYEYLSLFFNLIQIAANGVCLPFRTVSAGLFGPVVLISRSDYQLVGGHASVRACVAEDLALGQILDDHEIRPQLFLGDGDVTYRMYTGGGRQLIRGWLKNMATGAATAPARLVLMSFLWVTGCMGAVVDLIRIALAGDLRLLLPAAVLLIIAFVEVLRAARMAGSFRLSALLVYPVWLAAFILIFVLSLIYRLFKVQVVWKDRKVDICK